MFWFLCLVAGVLIFRWQWKKIKAGVHQWKVDRLTNAEEELAAVQRRMLELYERNDEADKPKIEKYNKIRWNLEQKIRSMKSGLV